jgi:hypothetical protein
MQGMLDRIADDQIPPQPAARVLDLEKFFILISRRLAAFPIGFGAFCRLHPRSDLMDLKRFSTWTSFLPQFFDRKIYGTTAGAWIAFVLIAVLTFATLMAIRGVLKRTLGKSPRVQAVNWTIWSLR